MFDRFRAFSIRQQMTLAALAVGTSCVLLIGIWFFLLRTDYRPLFSELKPADAATIVADLERRKISYRLENGGTTVLVPADMVEATRLDVMTGDLPLKGTVGFELFNKSDVGLTDFAQKINYQRALQGELERTIMTLDGIDSARVHLSLGEERIFRDDRVPPKASVTIHMRKGATLTATAAQGVQRLIAAAVPNLDVADVVILDETGGVIGAPAHIEAAPGTGSPEAQEKSAIQEYYQALVRQALDRAYPQLGISVEVIAVTGVADAAAALPAWNPAARSFPLLITLSAASTLDATSQAGVRALIDSVVHSSVAQTDTIQFAVDIAPPARTVSRELPHAESGRTADIAIPAPMPEEDGRGEGLAVAALFGVLVLVLVGFFALTSRMRRPKRLSSDQRAQFSAKLRTALSPGGDDANRHF
jgi:flagellar M-ring protein FliF